MYWEKTSGMFKDLFEKPRMTEALLTKPPFRFLLDIFAQTTRVTGYAKNLYSEEELASSFYDTREKKILFLEKMKLLTEAMLREEIEVKPTRIVAGLEPEKTSLFLQAIHRAATSGEDSAPYVRKVHKKLTGRDNENEDNISRQDVYDQIVRNQQQSVGSGEVKGIIIQRRERPVKVEPRISSNKDDNVESIQKIIQDLAHNVNPIRSSMDLIPDDIESMNKEMKLWRNNFMDSKAQYQDEQAKTEELVQALLNKANELEELKKHQHSKIQAVKSNILQNEQRIQQLLFANVAK